MKPMDERIQRLLDGDLPPEEATALRAELRGCAELARWERQLAALSQKEPVEPSADFTRRVMNRVAARPAPQRSLWQTLLSPAHSLSFPRAALAAGSLAFVAALALAIGYRAGLSARPTAEGLIAAAPAKAGEKVVVRFALSAPDARSVQVVGSFNGWGGEGVKLARTSAGTWAATAELPRGHHEYTFVIDGERWVPDPAAAQLVDDGFGGHNAVLEL